MAEVDKRIDDLEARVTRIVRELNQTIISLDRKITRMDSDRNVWGGRIQMLEKQFTKFDRTARKSAKHLDPKIQKRNMLKMVDQALKAFDKKRG